MVRRIFATVASGVAITLVTLLGLVGGGGAVFAHAGYESSTPADGEVLAEPPERIDAYFGQEMSRSEGLPTMIVVNAAGDVIADEATLDDDDRTHLSIELPPALPNGRYTVIWHTLSDEDGEDAQGAFHYYVGEGPDATAAANGTPGPTRSPEPTPNDDGDDDGVPFWAVVGGVAVGLLVGVGAGFAMRRRS